MLLLIYYALLIGVAVKVIRKNNRRNRELTQDVNAMYRNIATLLERIAEQKR